MGAERGHGQGRRVGADDDQPWLRIEPPEKGEGLAPDPAGAAVQGQPERLLQRSREVLRRLARRQAGVDHPVAEPERGRAPLHQLQEPPGGRIAGADALDQHLDAPAAGQAHVRRTAAPVDEFARGAVAEHGLGVDGHVGLDAAAGEISDDFVLAEQHLGAHAPRRAAVGREQGGQDAGLAGVQKAAKGRPDIVLKAEQRPVDVLQIHAKAPLSAGSSGRR